MKTQGDPRLSAEIFACPACRGALEATADSVAFRCARCGVDYPVVDRIPVFVPRDAEAVGAAKAQQASFFDSEDGEFELMRPHDTPALYQHLLREKFRYAVSQLRPVLEGGSVLVVCGGSGMDAEFLARAGATVVSSDISLGAARRARERASRYGLAVSAVVADVEQLPFRDGSFDLVYVHDGLHHLERPLAGLAEMARVASTAVSVTEPARAAVTALAVRLGLALAREQAGNEVMRLTADEVAAALWARRFRIVEARRYAMYYRHHPGRISEFLSRRRVLPATETALAVLNVVFGRFGNKLAVQAWREPSGDTVHRSANHSPMRRPAGR